MVFNIAVIPLKNGVFSLAGKGIIMSPRFKQKAGDYTSVWKKSQVGMRKNIVQVWREGQGAWLPLSSDYKKWKGLHGYSTQKNVQTGKMYNAMKYGQINEMAPTVWAYGIDRTSGDWTRGKAKGPYPEYANKQRPFVRLTKEFIDTVQNNMKDYIVKLWETFR